MNKIKLSVLITSCFLMLISLCLSSSAHSASRLTPGSNAKAAVTFLMTLQRGTTYAEFKHLLPKDVHIEKVYWGQYFDTQMNIVKFNGSFSGYVTFLNDHQRQKFASGVAKPSGPQEIKLKTSDPIHAADVFLDNEMSSPTNDRKRIEAVERVLGRSKDKLFKSPTDDGGYASWKLLGNRTIEFRESADFPNAYREHPMLCLSFH